jgi:GTP-binding protein
MAFVDELTIYAKAGDGGNGVVRWRQEKFIPEGGPSGGDGGRGGDVYIETIRDVAILAKYSHNPKFIADNGEDGSRKSMHGENGKDAVIQLPLGSLVINKTTGQVLELTKVGERIKILSGGKGGYGNEHFKASTNTTPYEWTPGKTGEDAELFVELRLFADLGLVGFPNAGKSTLIQALTNSKSKIGAYAFTTLDPHLGAFYEFVIADIPGIIEGAGEGKGLGIKFLKHIARTKTLVHLISFENEALKEGGMMEAYETIRKELATFDEKLLEKDEFILLTKTDMVTPDEVQKVVKQFSKLKKPFLAVSMFDGEEMKTFEQEILKLLRK